MLGQARFPRIWRHRHRGLLAVVGAVLALSGIAIALAPPPSSQAAQGERWPAGIPAAGALSTKTARCSVTVVSQWLAITSKHCGTDKPKLKLDVADVSNAGDYKVKSITPNPTLDVEAIFLEKKTDLTVMPLRASVAPSYFSAWGYGLDRSNQETNHLTSAKFNLTGSTPSAACLAGHDPSQGSLCWPTTATNSVCRGDSGGPVTQNLAIIGMITTIASTGRRPDGSVDCSKVINGQALTVQEMQPWLDQMIKEADPSD